MTDVDPRMRLEQRLAELTRRQAALERHLRQEDGRLEQDFADQVAYTEMDEVIEALDDAGRAEVEAIHAALRRLDEGTYGVCPACGGEIEPGRLAAVPTAVLCARCAREAEGGPRP